MRHRDSSTRQPDTSDTDTQPSELATRLRVRRFMLAKKTILIGVIVVAAVVTGLLVRQFTVSDSPEYSTVLPDGKSASELGGWKRVSPPDKDPVFAYHDEIDDIPITVSQQPLPDSFRTETANHVADLAKKYNATTEITAGNTIVYIGTSVKGPQSVIFTKKDLLILIKSQKKIDDTSWTEYVKLLDGNGGGRIPKY